MYNCLRFTRDPHEILKRIVAVTEPGTVVRIFEWIDGGADPRHPQNITESLFWDYFSDPKVWDRKIWNVGTINDGDAHGKYIALAVQRK